MSDGPPKILKICHDDYHAEFVGRTADGRQFFVTNPFVPKMGDQPGREFHAVYLFDKKGKLLEALIDDLGPRAKLDPDAARVLRDKRIAELGDVEYCDIDVAPFQLEKFGTVFGLVPQAPEDEDEDWWVTVEPGDYMAFSPPWDGDYDT
jgi:hypothetical protein